MTETNPETGPAAPEGMPKWSELPWRIVGTHPSGRRGAPPPPPASEPAPDLQGSGAPWWGRIYDPAASDTHAAKPEPDAAREPESQPAAEDPEEGSQGPSRWWSKRATSEPEEPLEPFARPAAPYPQLVVRAPQPALDRRTRWLLANGSAALAGWGLGAVFLGPAWTNHALTACAADPAALASDIATLAAGTGAWILSGSRSARAAVAIILPGSLGLLARPAAVVAAVTWANALAPHIANLLRRYGAWPGTVAPLATAAIVAALAWQLLGTRSRYWSAPLKWIARVPTATALLAVALYTPSR